MTVVIGLTGSIASGKSTVSLMFDEFSIPVIDADKIAREVVRPNEPAYRDIVEYFGRDILREDQTLNRKALGEIVFNDQAKLDTLNRFVHPKIRERMIELRDAYVGMHEKAVVLDIPLLFENNLSTLIDKTIVVTVDEETQIKRLMEREEFTRSEALNRIQVQMPLKEKEALADHVINNNGDKYDSYLQLQDILRELEVI